MESFSYLDYLIFIVVLAVSLLIGLHQAFKKYYEKIFTIFNNTSSKANSTQNDDDENTQMAEYLVASSSMGTLPIACSLLATYFSATTLLGTPAEVYQYGIQYWISVFGIMIPPLIGALVTGPMFAKLNVSSVFEYLKLRYNSRIVNFLALKCYLAKCLINTALFIFAPSTALYFLAKITPITAIAIIGILGTFYTAIGGIRAVIWTDVFQLLIMFGGLILISCKGLYDIGSFKELIRINSEGGRLNFLILDPNPFIRQSFWSLIFGMMFYFLPHYCIDQQMIQRFSATRNIRSAQKALMLNSLGIFLLITICCFPGLIIYATYAKCDPLSLPERSISSANQILPYYVVDKLNSIKGSIGILLAAILAGSLSSVSSSLNSSAAILWGDILKDFTYFKTLNDSKSTVTTKCLVVIVGVLSTILACIVSALSGNLVQVNLTLNGSLNAPILGVFILAAFFPFSNAYGAASGLITGFSMALWLTFGAYIYKPQYPKLSYGTECLNNTLVSKQYYNISDSYVYGEAINISGSSKFYSISYLWFSAIGTLTTVFVGIIVSILTGCNKQHRENNTIEIKLQTF